MSGVDVRGDVRGGKLGIIILLSVVLSGGVVRGCCEGVLSGGRHSLMHRIGLSDVHRIGNAL
jgi:hypothetical protein